MSEQLFVLLVFVGVANLIGLGTLGLGVYFAVHEYRQAVRVGSKPQQFGESWICSFIAVLYIPFLGIAAPYYGYLELKGWPLLSGLAADHKFLAGIALVAVLVVFVPLFEYLLRKVARSFCPQVQFVPISSLWG